MRHLRSAALLLLLALAAGPLHADVPPTDERHAIRVVSLNLAMREDADRIVGELTARGVDADVVLLQEVIQRGGLPDVASQMGQKLGLEPVFRAAYAIDPDRAMGLAILSRYRATDVQVLPLKRYDLSFRSRHRIALGAVVDTPEGRIRVYNVHLDTRINVQQRIDQLAAVTAELQAAEEPAIVGGDLNTNDNRWLFHTIPLPFLGKQRDGVLRFMEQLGFRSAVAARQPTHDAFGMQLDWIFVRGLSATAASVQPMDMSDHHAVIASVSRAVPPESAAAR